MSPIRPENRDRYPPDWPEISRRIRFSRAGGWCECHGECGRPHCPERCDREHGAPIRAEGRTLMRADGTPARVVLTTAHLNHQPEDCRDENLRAMCQACHLAYDRAHHEETRAANAPQQPLFRLGQS